MAWVRKCRAERKGAGAGTCAEGRRESVAEHICIAGYIAAKGHARFLVPMRGWAWSSAGDGLADACRLRTAGGCVTTVQSA
eukprot:353493-Chlamydomonas_euryale.AAC.2